MQVNAQSRFFTLEFTQARTYLWTLLLVVGNIALPQLCHLLPQGGMVWLPIYFFTLVGAYKFGWKVGVLTALASPIVNSLLFGMPPVALLPVILVKSVLLAISAAWAARFFGRVSLLILLGVVLAYQIPGGLFEWAYTGSLDAALQDFRLGIPGMLVQVVLGFLILVRSNRKM